LMMTYLPRTNIEAISASPGMCRAPAAVTQSDIEGRCQALWNTALSPLRDDDTAPAAHDERLTALHQVRHCVDEVSGIVPSRTQWRRCSWGSSRGRRAPPRPRPSNWPAMAPTVPAMSRAVLDIVNRHATEAIVDAALRKGYRYFVKACDHPGGYRPQIRDPG